MTVEELAELVDEAERVLEPDGMLVSWPRAERRRLLAEAVMIELKREG